MSSVWVLGYFQYKPVLGFASHSASSGGRRFPQLPPSRSTNPAVWPHAALAGKSTLQHRQSSPPAALEAAAGRVRRTLIFDPPAYRRQRYANNARNGALGNAFPVQRQGLFPVTAAGAGIDGAVGVIASAIAVAIDSAAFGSPILGHPVGAALRAADAGDVSARGS